MEIAILVLLAALTATYLLGSNRIKAMKLRISALRGEISAKDKNLNKLFSEHERLTKDFNFVRTKADAFDKITDYDQRIERQKLEIVEREKTLNALEKRINVNVQHMDLEEGGFFRYKFRFEEIEKYAIGLKQSREAQYAIARGGDAFSTSIEGLEDSTIINCIGKLGLRTFNAEAELAVNRATTTNYEACRKKIVGSYETISKLMSPLSTTLNQDLLKLKLVELDIGLEYAREKERIEEEQADLRRRMAEEEKEREDAERAVERAVDEEMRYESQIAQIRKELEGQSAEEVEKLNQKIAVLQGKLTEAQSTTERALSNAQITRRGHIYIISNVGSFGENVFKIGMTRRSDPNERIAELSNASVPFRFDIHAMIQTEDAPALESTLHETFDERRLNRVNGRKEFFRISIDEIAEACQKIGVQVKLTRLAEASEYRETLELTKRAA